MDRACGVRQPCTVPSFTDRQGQYLAFIDAYTRVHGRPPSEADLQRHFGVTPPSVHQMVLTLKRAGLIRRQPRVATCPHRSRRISRRLSSSLSSARCLRRWVERASSTGRRTSRPSPSVWRSTSADHAAAEVGDGRVRCQRPPDVVAQAITGEVVVGGGVRHGQDAVLTMGR